jgi:hypothetical protein
VLKESPVRARHGLNSHFYTYVACIAVTAPHDVRGGHLEQFVADVGHRARRDDSSNEVLVQEREREVDAVAIPWQKTLMMTPRTHLYTKSINS